MHVWENIYVLYIYLFSLSDTKFYCSKKKLMCRFMVLINNRMFPHDFTQIVYYQ